MRAPALSAACRTLPRLTRRLLTAIGMLAAVALLPTAAGAEDRTIGRWTIGGETVCSMTTAVAPDRLLMVIAPDGDNQGGLIVTPDDPGQFVAGDAVVVLSGEGAPTGRREAVGYDGLNAYFVPFLDAAEIDRFADHWELRASIDGAIIADHPVTGFRAAVVAFRACIGRTHSGLIASL